MDADQQGTERVAGCHTDRRSAASKISAQLRPGIVWDLEQLISGRHTFRTVFADPPWQYQNTASRGAAANHYPTMTVAEICDEPIHQLVEEQAHLHLWTTNAFLEPAFTVMRTWGFEYKSCLVWIKPGIGMGNYWRVSHEYLLAGGSRSIAVSAE